MCSCKSADPSTERIMRKHILFGRHSGLSYATCSAFEQYPLNWTKSITTGVQGAFSFIQHSRWAAPRVGNSGFAGAPPPPPFQNSGIRILLVEKREPLVGGLQSHFEQEMKIPTVLALLPKSASTSLLNLSRVHKVTYFKVKSLSIQTGQLSSLQLQSPPFVQDLHELQQQRLSMCHWAASLSFIRIPKYPLEE